MFMCSCQSPLNFIVDVWLYSSQNVIDRKNTYLVLGAIRLRTIWCCHINLIYKPIQINITSEIHFRCTYFSNNNSNFTIITKLKKFGIILNIIKY